MTRILLSILLLAAPAAGLPAQLQDGDLIYTGHSSEPGCGFVFAVRPSPTSQTTVVAKGSFYRAPYQVRMAANNRDIIVGDWGMYRLSPRGVVSTFCRPVSGGPFGFELDHDGHWLISGNSGYGGSTALWTLCGTSLSQRITMPYTNVVDLLIDRDPGASPYVLALENYSTLVTGPQLLGCDRHGITTTIRADRGGPLRALTSIELWPGSGDYLACANCNLYRVTKSGQVTTLSTRIPAAWNTRINQDGTAWVIGWDGQKLLGFYRIDGGGVVTTAILLKGWLGVESHWPPPGLEVYGSRRLVCNGTGAPGTTVQIRLQSRRPGDALKPYALACSFWRRPGLRAANGEWLNLGRDALFWATTSGDLAGIFQNFRGVTDPSGEAAAAVHIPRALPSNLDLTVFVAGVIFSAKNGVQTVTNTHWFVLN